MNLDQISTSLSTRSIGNLRDRGTQWTSGDLQGTLGNLRRTHETSGDLRGPQGTIAYLKLA